ncbi:hypothetical protein MHH33_06945 [Paenisporosarcina sp. FSL H8-0542]|uniref:hypothetical protein n=1 Tax=Paenisporosarcina sp. FSL H8-0542 TaxID=2921401 RepID=UPI00315AC42A
MGKYKIQTVWSSLKKEESIAIGYIRAYLGECSDGKWVVVITDSTWEESEVLVVNNRVTATKRIRDRGFWTRMRKIFPRKQ